MKKSGIYRKYGKRALDIVIAGTGLLVLWPVLLILAALVRIKLGPPAVFKQVRPGKQEKLFILYKFRTMTGEMDGSGNLLPDDKRMTRFGKALRVISLDELPQLWNILKGDMSFVGPRPLLVEYLPFYNEQQKRRHEVSPGLTGLAQVMGRNELSWEKRFDFDVEYVDGLNFFLDVKIMAKTIIKVVRREGITSSTAATMEKYKIGEK